MEEVASTVSSSSRSGHNIPQLVKDPDKPVIFYDWRAFLQQQFKPLKHLTKYHHFKVMSSKPNVVVCREFVDSEEVCVNLSRKCAGLQQMPEPCPPAGLDAARQWYLYDSIREFCTSDRTKDICCPRPLVPKKEVDLSPNQVSAAQHVPIGSKRKSALLN